MNYEVQRLFTDVNPLYNLFDDLLAGCISQLRPQRFQGSCLADYILPSQFLAFYEVDFPLYIPRAYGLSEMPKPKVILLHCELYNRLEQPLKANNAP